MLNLIEQVKDLIYSRQTKNQVASTQLLFLFQSFFPFPVPAEAIELFKCEPVFRDSIRRCSHAAENLTGHSIEKSFFDEDFNRKMANDSGYAPIAFVALQIALTDLYREKGIFPDAVIGFSIGEISSCYAAAVLTLEEAMMVMCHILLQQNKTLRGTMIKLRASPELTRQLCAEAPMQLYITAYFGPTTSQFYCLEKDIPQVIAFLKEKNVDFQHFATISSPYHTPILINSKEGLIEQLSELQPRRAQIPIYASHLGGLANVTFDGQYWADFCTETMFFNNAFETILKDGYTTRIEIASHHFYSNTMNRIEVSHEIETDVFPAISIDGGNQFTFSKTLETLKETKNSKHQS